MNGKKAKKLRKAATAMVVLGGNPNASVKKVYKNLKKLKV